jgi:hypothetical protein
MRRTHLDQRRLVESVYIDVCDRFTETMTLYAVATLRNDPSLDEFEEFRRHMRTCASCQESYQDLLMVLEAEKTEAGADLAEIPVIPPPWVAQKETPAPVEQEMDSSGFRVWLTQQGDALVRLMVELSNLGRLTPQIETRAHPHKDDRSAETPSEEFIFDTTGIEHVQDVELRVAVAVDQTNPLQRELRVEISLPARWPDFSGATVSLHWATGEVRSQLTGRNGIVKFAGLTQDEIRRARVEVSLPTT